MRRVIDMSKKNHKEVENMSTAPTAAASAPTVAKKEQVTKDDLFPMQLSWKEFENATLKAQMAQMQLEQANKSAEDAKKRVGELNQALNKKYGLDVQRDRINLETGDITRG